MVIRFGTSSRSLLAKVLKLVLTSSIETKSRSSAQCRALLSVLPSSVLAKNKIRESESLACCHAGSAVAEFTELFRAVEYYLKKLQPMYLAHSRSISGLLKVSQIPAHSPFAIVSVNPEGSFASSKLVKTSGQSCSQ